MRLSDQITLKIKELIQEKGLVAGDKLPSERALAELFKVSRPPIREALRTLVSCGLVMTRASGGTYLQTSSNEWPEEALKELNSFISDDPLYRYDVLEARQALERTAARLAALRATQKDKENIIHCYEVIVAHQKRGEAEQAAKADAEFHLAIAKASHNVVLLQIMRSLFNLLLTNVTHNRQTFFADKNTNIIATLTEQHHTLLQAILTADPIKAEQAVSQHLDYIASTQRSWDEDSARQQRVARAITETS